MSEFIYAVLFDTGLVKVGRTKNIKARLKAHREALACAGIAVTDHYFAPCERSAAVEKILIAKCSAYASERIRAEWFPDLRFDRVRSWIDEACAEAVAAGSALDGDALDIAISLMGSQSVEGEGEGYTISIFYGSAEIVDGIACDWSKVEVEPREGGSVLVSIKLKLFGLEMRQVGKIASVAGSGPLTVNLRALEVGQGRVVA